MAQRQQGKKKRENKEDGPEAVSEDEKKKERNEGERDLQKNEDLCGPCVTANQLQLALKTLEVDRQRGEDMMWPLLNPRVTCAWRCQLSDSVCLPTLRRRTEIPLRSWKEPGRNWPCEEEAVLIWRQIFLFLVLGRRHVSKAQRLHKDGG